MVWLHCERLPQRSVAAQMRTATKVFPHSPLVVVLRTVMATLVPSHASRAVGALNVKGVPHSTVWFWLQARVGGVVSTTVMVWLQLALLPHWSVARQVRVAV